MYKFFIQNILFDLMIRAVIVDDDKETVQIFKELLSSNGIDVVGLGYNGQDAVFLYKKLSPDIIFLDVMMPIYDGIYALEKIRELDKHANIMMVYDKIPTNKQVEMNRLKPSAIITEPIDVNQILTKIHQLCSLSDESDSIKKNLIILAIKNTLLELGTDEYDKIIEILKKDFDASINDCYDHPEYLKRALQDLLGNSYPDVFNSLKENLKTISNKDTQSFIHSMNS